MYENRINPAGYEAADPVIQTQTDETITKYAAYADQNWRDQRHPDTLSLQFHLPESKGTITFSTVKGIKTTNSLLTDSEIAIDVVREYRDKLYSSESYRLGRGETPSLLQLVPYGDSGNEYMPSPVDAEATRGLIDILANATPPKPTIKSETTKKLGKISRQLIGRND